MTGTAVVTLGAESPEASAARAATGGASPASGGAVGTKAGNLAVRVAPGSDPDESARAVAVQVTAQDKGTAAGVTGPLVALSDAGSDGSGGRTANVTLDLKALQAAGWSERAELVALPACALTAPDMPECRTQTPVASKADGRGGITAEVTLPPAQASAQHNGAVKASFSTDSMSSRALAAAAPSGSGGGSVVLAAAPSPSGSLGNYKATSLSPSSAWSAGSNSGNFTYGYPIQVPPALGGSTPPVALGYNSADVDGKTSASNAQPSWIGDGWGYEPGFIERSYKSCDKAGITGSPDQCWGGQNATLSLSGHSGAIVRDDASGVWHLENDDGTKVEQLTGAPKAAGDIAYQGMEYWRITTPDGVQYYFGLNHLPGGDAGDPAANSVLTEPVYSPNSGDPCYNSGTGKNSWCQMAWRWQLDHVVDPHGNLITYKYATEGNKYKRGNVQSGGKGVLTDYQRSGYLTEIAYGQRLDEQKAAKGKAKPAARVQFAVAERCTPNGSITCAEAQRTTANAAAWPDTPIDQICTDNTCVNSAPTFFTTKRLTTITTQVLVDAAYRTVDTWNLNQQLADPGDGTKRLLQLDSVQRVPSNGQAEVKNLPLVLFEYKMRANRVDGLVPAEKMFMRPRIQGITTETGGRIDVVYTDPQCSRVENRMPASEDNNSLACIPIKWYLPGQSSPDPVNDWFDKPLVKTVVEQDLVSSPSVSRVTEYTYNGGAAWHRNDAEFTDPKTRTWNQFRGYQSVTTTTGSGDSSEAPKTQQKVTYLRGMVGDYLADGKTLRTVPPVTSPLGGTVTDSAQLSGRVVATETFDRADGSVVAVSGSTYNGQQKSATHAQSAGAPQLLAWRPDSETTSITRVRLADGSWRTTTTVTTSEPANGNRVVKVDDKGDGTTATPELCTTTGYATSDNPQLLTLVSERTTLQGPCGAKATSANTLSSGRTLYDGRPFGRAGPTGDSTGNLILDHFDQAGNPVYAHGGSATFDVYGRTRTTATTDGSTYNNAGTQLSGPSVTPTVTTTATTPATGALPTQVQTTGPMGADWTTTTTLDPARGSALTSTDANGRVITAQYDALGRLTAVWAPDRPTSDLPSRRFTYELKGTAGPSAVTTESLNDDAATFAVNVDLYDGLGRARQSQRTSDARPTGRLITDTVYDTHGWAIKTSSAYYEEKSFPTTSIFVPAADGQIPGQTWNTYDGNGRVVQAEFRSYGNPQWAATTAYPGADRTDTVPPSGGMPASSVTDARGRATALWQYRTPTATGNPADADVTTYTYTPTGQPASRTDSSGNTWTTTYDLRGRKVSASDPDTGLSQVFYDVNSRIDRTVDAKGNTLAYTYDLLGRKTGTYGDSVTPANQLAAWTYDTLAKGQATASTRYVGGSEGAAYTTAVTGYDTGYRALGASITIPAAEGPLAGTYTTTNSYSPVLGAVTETAVPAAGGLPAESITYGRTITGLLVGSASLEQAVVAQVDYDALARPIRTTVGDYGTQVVSTQQYDWATGRVINSFLDRQLGTASVDQTTYTYTPSGRITSVTDVQDASATDTQCYTYDHLGRLTGAWTDTGGTSTTADWTDSNGVTHGTGGSATVPGIGSCNNANGPAAVEPGGRTVGGQAPYWNTYSYDATGNRTGQVQRDITGNAFNDTTTSQTFGAARSTNTPTNAANTGGGTGGPHALLTSTATGPAGTRAVGYQYDAAGNPTAITDTGGTATLAWNREGKLDSISSTGAAGTTSYVYDADGNQLIRRNPGRTTLNLPTDELTLDTATGALSNVRSIGGGGGLTYTRVTSAIGGGNIVIQAADPHGTNGVQINTDANQTVTRRPTDPFGNPRGNQPATSDWAGSKGFVSGTKDEATGLTNLGARQYDPLRGRFINPDPILDPADPQQWNGYAYSENDPVNLSDPSGYKSEECGTLYDCGSAGTITTSNAAETTSTYTPENAQKRYYEESLAATLGPVAKRNWISDQVSKNNASMHGWGNGVKKKSIAEKAGDFADGFGLVGGGFVTDALSAASHLGQGQFGEFGWDVVGAVPAIGDLAKANHLKNKADDLLAAAAACQRHSFPPDTLVLMADGSTRPIEDVKPGDAVASSDPQTGESASKPVTAKIITPNDTEFTELTVTDGSTPTTIVSTAHHPYWDETTQRWTPAAQLQPGHRLATVDHDTLTVLAARNYTTTPQRADDLTVDDLHTYYVLAGSTPVLVHNCNDLPEGYTSSPALKGDPYHPDSVAGRSAANQELYGATPRDLAANLGYKTRIPAQKAPFDSHGQEVFSNGKNYITPDVDGHNVTGGWKMFNRRGVRIGTYDGDLNYLKE
ncbi:polymorphic toxin-type HINT domain-containing protein [Kitasatospora purpeofusca]|uniref:polymorphic toxin-type HINT domain-containing protein n=1 Tax=Kitasatospora purpeofusca TaxID=67352 RepID=UPI00225A086F|nr:polymorphic toxin-type HINT domain-containing protein [Kitasatospora purpeofusca]MCX4756216.1 polymorphic toxin-type HINT domain-containing protein [Kitasatospora purpeofusca]WSR35953.1 polymorphic toxin-type HINT domain-containing protein [Kitasatospora purpeofusca]